MQDFFHQQYHNGKCLKFNIPVHPLIPPTWVPLNDPSVCKVPLRLKRRGCHHRHFRNGNLHGVHASQHPKSSSPWPRQIARGNWHKILPLPSKRGAKRYQGNHQLRCSLLCYTITTKIFLFWQVNPVEKYVSNWNSFPNRDKNSKSIWVATT